MKKQRLKRENEVTDAVVTEVCVHQCFFSPDWLVGFAEVLRCWCFVVSNGSFVCLFVVFCCVFFYFLKKGTKFLLLLCTFSNRLVLLRQPTPKFAPTASLTDKETSRLLAVWHFDSYSNRGFPRLPSSRCRKQRRRDYTEDGGWFGGGRERFSGAVYSRLSVQVTWRVSSTTLSPFWLLRRCQQVVRSSRPNH